MTDGRRVARRGDIVICPWHGANPIVAVLTSELVTSSAETSHIGSVSACGAVIVTGSNITFHAK